MLLLAARPKVHAVCAIRGEENLPQKSTSFSFPLTLWSSLCAHTRGLGHAHLSAFSAKEEAPGSPGWPG